jgi:alkylphenol/PAH-inducible cytochrome P450 monooxygenase
LHPSLVDAIFRATWRFLPLKLVRLVRYLPKREYSRARRTKQVIDKVSTALVNDAIEEAKCVEIEKGKKDVMSVLGMSHPSGSFNMKISYHDMVVRANMSENPSLRLSKDEMVSQMAALTLAGHETTATTLTWLLWELAQHPEFQEKLRQEIRDKREEKNREHTNASPDFSMEDLESMPFLQAVLKVGCTTDPCRFDYLCKHVGSSSLPPHHISSLSRCWQRRHDSLIRATGHCHR